MAAWPREESYLEVVGTGGATKTGGGTTSIDLIHAGLLNGYHRMNPTNSNDGGWARIRDAQLAPEALSGRFAFGAAPDAGVRAHLVRGLRRRVLLVFWNPKIRPTYPPCAR